jgi:hypothetical protein
VKREARGDREHRAKVHANENKVIRGARTLDPDDRSDSAEYIREVAADIVARRAASN